MFEEEDEKKLTGQVFHFPQDNNIRYLFKCNLLNTSFNSNHIAVTLI